MGDGRYYTYFQFADIIILTFLSVLSLVSILFFYYRKNKDMSITYITAPSLLILVFLFIRIIESVIPNLEIASSLRELQLVLLVACVILCVLNKKHIENKLMVILIITIILGVNNLFLNIIFITYEFHNIIYTSFYKVFILILIIALCSYLVLKKKMS